MKILAFAVREDEIESFNRYSKKFSLDISFESKSLRPDTVFLAKGFDGVTFLGNCNVNQEVLKKLNSYGIKFIASRSVGYNNVDLESAKKYEIKVSNATYSPYSVAEFALMISMMMLRHIPKTIKHIEKNNFSLNGLLGREVRNQQVGVIGTGKIGKIVYNLFKSLGASVVAYDLYQNNKDINYVCLDELLKTSDIITLHTPLTAENYHLIDKNSISKMKNDVIIINTARGELINLIDILEGLNSNKIGGVAFDTFEKEVGIVHKDCSEKGYDYQELKNLLTKENVLITSHQAFYTEQAVSDMVESALKNLIEFNRDGTAQNEII